MQGQHSAVTLEKIEISKQIINHKMSFFIFFEFKWEKISPRHKNKEQLC
jgi:hypothetical protein